jgi:hypothetical protein
LEIDRERERQREREREEREREREICKLSNKRVVKYLHGQSRGLNLIIGLSRQLLKARTCGLDDLRITHFHICF